MEENTVQTLVAMEISEPARKLKRSQGALYLALTALILAVISIANVLYARWQIPRYFVQPPLYALIAAACAYVYRRHYISFRYTLTDQTFAVERVAGNSDRALAAMLLADIESIDAPHRALPGRTRVLRASVRKARESKVVFSRMGEDETAILISPSEEFFLKLKTQWQIAAKRGSK